MNYKFKTTLLLLMLALLFKTPTLAIDLNELGDFSSRSLIMRENKDTITQEQKDELQAKKLTRTAQCLITQIKKNNYENVVLLVETKTNLNSHYLGDYPIYIAAKKNNFEIVKLLFENGAKLDRGFSSELYEAVKNKNTQMAQFLIDNKAKINYKDTVTENTILYLALKNNMLDIAKQLINKGAYADKKSVLIVKKKKLFDLIKD